MSNFNGCCCWVCGIDRDLTKHHVFGGKRKDRQANPFQEDWIKKKKKVVILCRECHNLLHQRKREQLVEIKEVCGLGNKITEDETRVR